MPENKNIDNLLGPKSLEIAKTTMCEDAFNLMTLVYETYYHKTDTLPAPPKQTIDISPMTIISLEGINCAGKTTQVKRLAEIFRTKNPIIAPRFYDCVPAQILKNQTRGLFYRIFNPITDSLLIASAYIEKFNQLLKRGHRLVITDRGADSLYVSQGRTLTHPGRSLGTSIKWLMDLVKNVDKANFRFYLNVPLDTACKRRKQSGRSPFTANEIEELSQNIKIYKLLQEKFKRYIIIDGTPPINTVTEAIVEKIKI